MNIQPDAWAADTEALRARAEKAEARIQAVRGTLLASDDGTEYEHNGHRPAEGEPECPGCWAASILRALDGTMEG